MKSIKLALAATTLAIAAPIAAAQDSPAETAISAQTMVTAKVNGMVCDFCARAVTKVFGKQDAVEGVAVVVLAEGVVEAVAGVRQQAHAPVVAHAADLEVDVGGVQLRPRAPHEHRLAVVAAGDDRLADGFGLVERTFLQIVAVLAAPLADARLVGSRIIASSTSAAASAASARGRGLLGLLLLDLGTTH